MIVAMPGPCVAPLDAGAGEAIPSVGMLPANTVPESAQVRASVITNRFMEVSPCLRMQDF
jgi:hypothetical protein